VPGTHELDRDAVGHLDLAMKPHRMEVAERAVRVGLVVQRHCRRVLAVPVPIRLTRVFFLNPARIGKDQPAQLSGAGGAKDWAGEALFHQARDVTHVVEMCVGEHHRVDRRRRNWQVLPVPKSQFLQPLEQPAIEQHRGLPVSQEVFRPRDRAGGP
jgi:hypothetical protein